MIGVREAAFMEVRRTCQPDRVVCHRGKSGIKPDADRCIWWARRYGMVVAVAAGRRLSQV